jgi:hypothetical protein
MLFDNVSRGQEEQLRTRTLLRRLLLFGVPLILGGLEIFHPVPGTSIVATLSPQVNWWLTLHLLQLPLFGLLAVAVLLLTTGLHGWAATISRIGVWFFIVFYLAQDDVAGIGTGIIIRAAQGVPSSQQAGIEQVVHVLFYDNPFLGGTLFSVIAALGVLGWLVGVIAAAIALYRARKISWIPLVLLVLAAIVFGYGHGSPTGPLGMLCFLAAALWIELAPKPQTPGQAVPAAVTAPREGPE